VVDGGSEDDTLTLSQSRADITLSSPAGRALQMNCGANHAKGMWLWFLHADTRVEPALLKEFLTELPCLRQSWGRFDIRLSGGHPMFRVIEFMINQRSRVTGVATGDQGLFVRQDLFHLVSGYPQIPLMEDVALSKILKKIAPTAALRNQLVTSSRRWEQYGIFKTILLMWRLRLAYFLGMPADQLAERYR